MRQLINGIAYGFSEIRLSLDGISFTALKAINYKDSIERGKLRGTSRRVLARTNGEHDAEADIELFEDEYRTLLALLGDGYMNKLFIVTVSYSNDDGTGLLPDIKVHTDTFAAKMKGDEHSHSQGTEPLSIKVPLDVFSPILKDGLDPLGVTTL